MGPFSRGAVAICALVVVGWSVGCGSLVKERSVGPQTSVAPQTLTAPKASGGARNSPGAQEQAPPPSRPSPQTPVGQQIPVPAQSSTVRVSPLMAGADRDRRQGPVFTLRRLPASAHPVLAGFAFKSVQGGTRAYIDSVEGAGAAWHEVYEPRRHTSGGVSFWIGEGITGGRVTVTFSAPLESGRFGWTFDAAAGVDAPDPFMRVRRSDMKNDTHQTVRLPPIVSRPVYGFVLVGRGGRAGLVDPGPGVDLLGRGWGSGLNVASVWSSAPRRQISASWGLQASNLIIGAELRSA